MRGTLARLCLCENPGARFTDFICNGQRAIGTGAFRIHHPLGHTFAVLHRELLDQHEIAGNTGPRGRAAMLFWLSGTETPEVVVSVRRRGSSAIEGFSGLMTAIT
jgi:hypothetical protein